jgi:uncharacterized protein YcbK (DUF882 family)
MVKNFNVVELACKDGTQVPAELLGNALKLLENLQVLRDHLGEPIRINSGYRTPAYNKRIGGRPQSMHMRALAADITVKSKTPKQLAAIIEKLISTGKMAQGGIGVYPGFLHYDVRGKRARW